MGRTESKISHLPLPACWSDDWLSPHSKTTDTTRVLFVGRLEVRKGVIDLADAVPLVLREIPAAEFMFVGSDGEAPEGGASMRAYLIKRMGPSARACRFVGLVERSVLPEIYSSATVAVFPSLWESFGYVCLEAMVAGCPVVVTRGTGLEEIARHGRAGLTVPPRSPGALARATVRMLRDPAARDRLAKAGRRRAVQDFSPDKIAPLQEKEYEHVIRARWAAGPRDRVSSLS